MKLNTFTKVILTLFVIPGLFVAYYFIDKNYGYRYYENIPEIETEKDVKNKKNELSILFVGDIMLDRNIRKIINEHETPKNFVSNFLGNFKEENARYDYVVANLEGPITENKTKTYRDDGSYTGLLHFTFPTSTPEILNILNIKTISLANNHTDNFYNKGFQETKAYLDDAKIFYFGNPYNDREMESLGDIFCEKDICIGYIGYHEFTRDNDSERIEMEIQKFKANEKVDFVIVMPHWGTEYKTTSTENQKYLAYRWIDAGADMVIGGHPHVIEESEIYKDKYIYYSLGNYIFDQWFEEDVKNGLAVNFKFTKEATGEEVLKNIELIKEVRVRSEKTGIGYILE